MISDMVVSAKILRRRRGKISLVFSGPLKAGELVVRLAAADEEGPNAGAGGAAGGAGAAGAWTCGTT